MNQTVSTHPRTSWRKRLLQGVALSSALAVGVAFVQLAPSHLAFAADGPAGQHGPGMFGGDMREQHRQMMHDHMQRVLADAGVGDAQRAKIDAIVKATMDDQHADMERMHADMKLMKDLLTAPTIDTAKFNTVRAEQEQLAIQTTRRLADTALAIAQQLTPQQRQALGSQIDQMFERHHGPHGPGFGPEGDGPHGGDQRPRE
jgi:Spy/CpxP family protein refolding chaperone